MLCLLIERYRVEILVKPPKNLIQHFLAVLRSYFNVWMDVHGALLYIHFAVLCFIQGPPYIFAPLLMFLKFSASFLKISRTNYTSLESPNIELLESGNKLGVAPSWGWPHPPYCKSNNFTKTRLEPSMTDLPPISKLVSCTTIQGFL